MTVGRGGAIVGPKRQALLVSDMAMAEDAPNGRAGQRIHDASRLSFEDVQNVVHGYADLRPGIDGVVSNHFKDIHRILNGIRDRRFYQGLSCGRSGTMWAYNFFVMSKERGGVPFMPYHHLPVALSSATISEMFYRGVTGRFETQLDEFNRAKTPRYFAGLYFRSRLTELLHSSIARVVMLNHWETPFAPILATYFSQSKFFHLDRNRTDTIFSILASTANVDQARKLNCAEFIDFVTRDAPRGRSESTALGTQLLPFDVIDDQGGGVLFDPVAMSPLELAVWQYNFSRMMAKSIELLVGGERFQRIDVDALFKGATDPMRAFVEFFELDRRGAELLAHQVSERVNAKFKAVSDDGVDEAKAEIEKLLA